LRSPPGLSFALVQMLVLRVLVPRSNCCFALDQPLFSFDKKSEPILMICPRCRSDNCLRSRRITLSHYILSAIDFRVWRCQMCENKFYARRVALPFSFYVHCPRCGNFDLDRVSRHRVDWGTFVGLKRMLGWPAYRCNPCRRKFFSIMVFRRIVPSTLPSKISRVTTIST
jgi:hypothetical protein